jgi:hypothetical protein
VVLGVKPRDRLDGLLDMDRKYRWSEVAPDFRTTGLVGGSLLRMALNGAEHDEDETED